MFQLESTGMRNALRQLRPERLEDVIAMVALYRPGPMEMIPDFIARRHGRVKPTYEHPVMEKHLQETYGIMVYQEQVLKIANDMAGFSMSEADDLRKAMGKKIAALMAEQRAKFLAGAKGRGVKEKVAERVFELMEKFAGYGFNKAHATAYGIVAYQTAYFKANYPVEFMAALLTSEMANTDKVVVHMDECRAMGIGVLPPDVNVSRFSFGVDGETIRFGLGAIKNLGQKAIEIIVGPAGAGRRLRVAGRLLPAARPPARQPAGGGEPRQGRRLRLVGAPAGPAHGRPRRPPSRPASGTSASATRARSPCSTCWEARREGGAVEPDLLDPSIAEWDTEQRLLNEKEVLGLLPLRATRSGGCGTAPSGWASWAPGSSAQAEDGAKVLLCGLVSALREINTKNGNRMGFATIEDVEGTIEVTIFPELFRQSVAHLKSGSPLLVRGKVEGTTTARKLLADDVRPLPAETEERAVAHAVAARLPGGGPPGRGGRSAARRSGRSARRTAEPCPWPSASGWTATRSTSAPAPCACARRRPSSRPWRGSWGRAASPSRPDGADLGGRGDRSREGARLRAAPARAGRAHRRPPALGAPRRPTGEVGRLEERLQRLQRKVFGKLTAWQRVQLARHPRRPYTLDLIPLLTEDFVELHGDRLFGDDHAIVGGLARLEGRPIVVVGHQKGRDTEEKLHRSFGMPHPEGYRKALRLMQLAERFRKPILTLIDTPGAYPGVGAEERGQAEAIARNLREMAGLPDAHRGRGDGGGGKRRGAGARPSRTASSCSSTPSTR